MATSLTVTFHSVRHEDDAVGSDLDTPEARYEICFERFRQALQSVAPDTCCTAAEFASKSGGNWRVLTFDDGLLNDFEVVFPELRRRALRGTFFITAGNIGKLNYTSLGQLREMAEAGMEIGSHGLTHRYLVTMSRQEATREIRESKTRLEQQLGIEVTSFAAVGGHYENWMLSVAAEAGYRVFATMIPGRTSSRPGLLLLRRNHLQSHHDARYVTQLMQGYRRMLLTNRLRYSLLKLPKTLLGMRNYDRLKNRVLPTNAPGPAGRTSSRG